MSLANKVIVCIDDDDKFLRLVSNILSNQGSKVLTCNSIKEFSLVFKTNLPDIIILDLNLGTSNGQSLLKFRKENPLLNSIPIIVCSADGHRKTIEQTILLGATDYIVKPINQSTLTQKLNRILRRKEILTYEFTGEQPRVAINAEATLVGISETNCAIFSPLKVTSGEVAKVEIKLFKDNEIKVQKFLVQSSSKSNQSSLYYTTLSMAGLNDRELDSIRKLKVGWSPLWPK